MKLLIVYFIIAHVFADFYLQNDYLIQLKSSLKGHIIHGLIHLMVMLPILLYQSSIRVVWAILFIVILHILLDIIKSKLKPKPPLLLAAFIGDQLLHIVSIYYIVDQMVQYARPYGPDNMSFALKLLALLVLLKPIDILIEFVFSTIHLQQDGKAKSNSRWIGFIERILFAVLIVLKMEMFVAVFIGVKTASRWHEVQTNKIFGLQYYIGTFISVLAGLIVGTVFITL